MSTTTSTLGLTKPALTDYRDITVINGNMDLIDAEAGSVRANAVKELTVSGRIITIKKINNTASTITTQDTTYTAGVGMTLSGTTFKAKLRSDTALTLASSPATETANRVYPVVQDKNGYLSVNVPWTDNNTTYSAGIGLSLSSGTFAVKTGYTTSGKNYKVQADSSGNLYVNVPWTDNNTWTANSSTAAGYVASGSGQANKVWKTDASGVPAWRADANTTYAVVTKGTNGLCPALPNESTTTKYLRQDGTWVVPPDTNTTYAVVAKGTNGLCPALPNETSTSKYLRQDGTWVVPPDTNTTYAVVSKSVNGLCPKLPNESTTTKYLRQDGTWVVPPNTTYSAVSKTANGLCPQLPNETTTTKYLRQDGTWVVPPNTWTANSSTAAGYVASGANQANKVWKTNSSGVPAWRDDANTWVKMTGASASEHGAEGYIGTAPMRGDQGKFWRGDATWANPVKTQLTVYEKTASLPATTSGYYYSANLSGTVPTGYTDLGAVVGWKFSSETQTELIPTSITSTKAIFYRTGNSSAMTFTAYCLAYKYA